MRKKEVVVLMYHSVEDTNWKYGVRKNDFARQIDLLARNYYVVPLGDIVAYIKGEIDLPDKTVAITFDDGYYDTYSEVFAIIKKYKIPITVFLTTDLEKKEKLGNFKRPTWEQIREMHDSGLVKFEVHGRTHRNFTEISDNERDLKNEIVGCVEDVKNNIGYSPRYIAYPSGNKNMAVVGFVKKNGFEAGFSINEGLVKKGNDLYLIKRVQVDKTMSFLQFKMRLTGAVDLNRKFIDLIRKIYERQ